MKCPLYKCPLYRDFLIRIWPGKRSVPRFTVRIIEMSALWCVRLIEIRLYKKKFRVQKILNFTILQYQMKLFQQLSRNFFFIKVVPVQSITDIVLMGFLLVLLSEMFISYYTIIYFFVKNFFSNVCISVNKIFECSYLSFGWEIDHPLSMSLTRVMEGVHPKCL